MPKPIIIAHRGVSNVLPENTLPAIKMALDYSCEGIEFDVQLTKDGVPVLIHDETIDRTSNGKGYVHEYAYKTLKTYNFGVNFSLEHVQIPTLEEVLHMIVLKDYKGLINIEMKNDVISYPTLEKTVLELVQRFGLLEQVVISSFNHPSIEKMRSLSSKVNLSLLYHENQSLELSTLQSLHAFSANIHIHNATASLISTLHHHHIPCFFYTANSVIEIERLLHLCVNGFFTDNPLFAAKIREP
jgi:glycerophosphoryl diester phosphodiesterase